MIGTAPASDVADVDDAVAAAGRRLPRVGGQDPRERSEALHKLARRIEGDIEHLSAIESENVGKPVSIMEFEMDLTLDNWRFFAAAGRFLEGAPPASTWPATRRCSAGSPSAWSGPSRRGTTR